MKIADVDLRGTGPEILVNVRAVAPSLGWSNVGLYPVHYVTPPEDGIQDINLVATPPSGFALPALQVFDLLLPIAAADWFQGVRIVPPEQRDSVTLRRARKGQKPIGEDVYFGETVGICRDKLVVDARFGGGCRRHEFQLSWDGDVLESHPPQVRLTLSHDANGDPCRAMLTERLQFDLSVLQGFPTTEMFLLLEGPGYSDRVRYVPPSAPEPGKGGKPFLELKDFHAIENRMPPGPTSFYVVGTVVFPTLGYEVALEPAAPQGINPRILILDLLVTPPSGPAGTQIDSKSVRWDRDDASTGAYERVSIRYQGEIVRTVPVQIVH